MTTALGNPRSIAIAAFAEKAVECSLSLFESLSHEDRITLKGMLTEFLECDDERERQEVAVSILEFVAPEKYFDVNAGIDLDEWFGTDNETKEAVAELAAKKLRFAEKLRLLLAEKGLTQTQLAEQLGVQQPTVAAILSGQHKPQPKTLKKLADALGLATEELWPIR